MVSLPWRPFCLAKHLAVTLTWAVVPYASQCLRQPWQGHEQMSVLVTTSPRALVSNRLPCPQGLLPIRPLRSASVGFTQTLLFWFDWPTLAWDPKRLHQRTSIKSCAPGPIFLSLSHCLHPALTFPVWPLKAWRALPSGCVNNKLLYFIVSCGLLWESGSPSNTLCST